MAETQTLEKPGTEAMAVELGQVEDNTTAASAGSMDMLLDIPMSVSVSLGGAQVPVHRLLQLGPGSVVQLDRLIEEPAELYVNDIKFATGDIVVVEGHFAIKIKEILG
ncbi:MAG: hypothetical protein A2Y07_05070 [Planctomycetes bacterium GWF2_50_10]|nr:MAG: hypothetical protein A2Y07_05070 [Planctomycetes bacterium GWF2_50_10]